MEMDTPYSTVDQNSMEAVGYVVSSVGLTAYWGFLGVGTTLDIFQNIIFVSYIEYGVLSISGYGVLSFILCGLCHKGGLVVDKVSCKVWNAVLRDAGYLIWKRINDRVFRGTCGNIVRLFQDVQLKSYEWINRRSKSIKLEWEKWIRRPQNCGIVQGIVEVVRIGSVWVRGSCGRVGRLMVDEMRKLGENMLIKSMVIGISYSEGDALRMVKSVVIACSLDMVLILNSLRAMYEML
ncbi:hypothetical protein Tco_0497804 [Tanacetum coccineum]